jgi:hypothetical protein
MIRIEIKSIPRYIFGRGDSYVRKGIKRMIKPIYLRPGMGLIFLLPLLLGCIVYNDHEDSYQVYYDGNRNTEGFPPVDSKVYFPGDTAIVQQKPPGLKKGKLEFLGWQYSENDTPIQPGEAITIGYVDVWLYAWWKDDPDNNPYEYTDNSLNGGVIITKYFTYDGQIQTITIPDALDGKPVTAIGEGAFANVNLDSIVLPAQLEVIGNKAFAYNSWIENIVIPDTVKSIGKLAFQSCSLKGIGFGKGLESIDDYAFDENNLTVLFLPENLKSVGEGAFYGNEVVSIEIGDTVTIGSESSMGIHGASFLKYYQAKGSRAGVYLYSSGAWKGPGNWSG